jgi:hypothetical protein
VFAVVRFPKQFDCKQAEINYATGIPRSCGNGQLEIGYSLPNLHHGRELPFSLLVWETTTTLIDGIGFSFPAPPSTEVDIFCTDHPKQTFLLEFSESEISKTVAQKMFAAHHGPFTDKWTD